MDFGRFWDSCVAYGTAPRLCNGPEKDSEFPEDLRPLTLYRSLADPKLCRQDSSALLPEPGGLDQVGHVRCLGGVDELAQPDEEVLEFDAREESKRLGVGRISNVTLKASRKQSLRSDAFQKGDRDLPCVAKCLLLGRDLSKGKGGLRERGPGQILDLPRRHGTRAPPTEVPRKQ